MCVMCQNNEHRDSLWGENYLVWMRRRGEDLWHGWLQTSWDTEVVLGRYTPQLFRSGRPDFCNISRLGHKMLISLTMSIGFLVWRGHLGRRKSGGHCDRSRYLKFLSYLIMFPQVLTFQLRVLYALITGVRSYLILLGAMLDDASRWQSRT